ncbi:MAG: 4-carboxymuconolactone decarboxylase [Aquisalimonadaceae bacterium]
MAEDPYDDGMTVRKSVLGEEHVARATAAATDFDRPFQELITRYAWGTVWHGEALSRRDRSLLTIALLAALGHYDELKMHIKATRNTGATPDEIREALLHVAIYGGVPAANHSIQIVKRTLAEMEAEDQHPRT